MERKTILVIPGSDWQIPLIDRIKKEGYRVVTVNPYDDSPCFKRADGYLRADIFDKEAVLKYAEEEQLSGLLSDECDIAMPLVAYYGNALSLPALSQEAARLYTDKTEMRKFGRINGFPCPEYIAAVNAEEGIKFFTRVNRTKLIMKPIDSNSSRGVFTIEEESDILEKFNETLKFSKNKNLVLLERYIEGTEFTVDGIKTPDRHYTLAISEKKHFSYNKNIACELLFSHENDGYDYQMLRDLNDSFVDKTDLQFGLTHAEYKYEDGKFYLIEIAARGGGNMISSHIVPYMSGVDNYQYLIQCCLGKIESHDFSLKADHKNRCAVLKFFDPEFKNGKINRIEGMEYLENIPDIVAYHFNFKEGDYLKPASDDSVRAGFYIACCENRARLEEVMGLIEDKVRIVVR